MHEYPDYAGRTCRHPCEDEDGEDDLECCVDCGSPEIAGICSSCGGHICAAHAVADGRLCTTCRKTRFSGLE